MTSTPKSVRPAITATIRRRTSSRAILPAGMSAASANAAAVNGTGKMKIHARYSSPNRQPAGWLAQTVATTAAVANDPTAITPTTRREAPDGTHRLTRTSSDPAAMQINATDGNPAIAPSWLSRTSIDAWYCS